MKVYNSADFHFGHEHILKFRKKFDSIEEHDSILLDKISLLNKNDILIVQGDFIFKSNKYDYYIEQLRKMSCRIKLILGNHDSLQLYKENRLPKLELCLPLYTYKGFWLSHCPIHPNEMRQRFGNVHGHTHHYNMNDDKYFCVSLDINNFEFVEFENIVNSFKKEI